MEARGFAFVTGCFSLLVASGCATTSQVASYESIKIANPSTGAITTCEKPLNTWSTKADAKAHLELAYDVKALIKSGLANVGSTGKFTGDLSTITEKVTTISQQSFDYMNFLYPYCVANGEGKLPDVEYIKRMDQLLDKFIKENTASVRFDRTADMSASKCENGKRVYKNVINDTLTFSEPIKEYVVQALTNDTGGSQTAEIWYILDGKKVTPIPESASLPFGTKRKTAKIPVNAERLEMSYLYEQKPSSDDDEWGISFVSSLPITSVHAKVTLPPGKQVSGLNAKYETGNGAFKGCLFTSGASPTLECDNKLMTTPNVPIFLVWNWDVFDGC